MWGEETSFGPHVEGLKTGRFDMMCAGDWPSAARGQYIDYPDPILYVRADDHRFDGHPEALDDPSVKIAAAGDVRSVKKTRVLPIGIEPTAPSAGANPSFI